MRLAVGPGQCSCGCGAEVAKGRDFKMGHDQRFRGMLMRAHLEGENIEVDGLPTQPALAFADRFGPSWRRSLVLAEAKKRTAINQLVDAASKDPRPHKMGKNPKVGWEICVITQQKNGGQEVRFVDKQGKRGRINVPPKAIDDARHEGELAT